MTDEGQHDGAQGDRNTSQIAEKRGEGLLQCTTTNAQNFLELIYYINSYVFRFH